MNVSNPAITQVNKRTTNEKMNVKTTSKLKVDPPGNENESKKVRK